MQPGYRQRQPRQMELFETPDDQPCWQDLPLRVRSVVIQELAWLLGSGRHPQAPSERREVGDE